MADAGERRARRRISVWLPEFRCASDSLLLVDVARRREKSIVPLYHVFTTILVRFLFCSIIHSVIIFFARRCISRQRAKLGLSGFLITFRASGKVTFYLNPSLLISNFVSDSAVLGHFHNTSLMKCYGHGIRIRCSLVFLLRITRGEHTLRAVTFN